MKFKHWIPIALLLFSAPALAQHTEAEAELQAIRQNYTGPGLKHIKGQMVLRDIDHQKQVDKVDFEYWTKNTLVFTRLNKIEILQNDSVYVMVNHQRKTIYVRNAQMSGSQNNFMDASQMSKILSQKGLIVKLDKKDGISALSVSGIQQSNFSAVTIAYRTADHRILNMEADVASSQMNQAKMKLKVTYEVTENKPVETAGLFATSRYLDISGNGTVNYSKKYEEYTKL